MKNCFAAARWRVRINDLHVFVFFVFLAFLTPRLAIAQHVSGGAESVSFSGTQASAYGWSEYYPGFISYANTKLAGFHRIIDSASYTVVGTRDINVVDPNGKPKDGNFVYGTVAAGRCYYNYYSVSARTDAGSLLASNNFTSGTACTDPPPPPPPSFQQLEQQGGATGGPSPIVISFEGDGDEDHFHISGPHDPVTFDLLADGHPIQVTWTRRGSRVGFLALDRNVNGMIDSGAELFGDHTPLAHGEPPPFNSNGYVALASYDNPVVGGNGDGHIGPEDRIWSHLLIWIDKNHDGVSQPDEIFTLEEAGIVELGQDYEISNVRDRFGNLFRYKSDAVREDRHGKREMIPTYDVFLQKVNR